MESRIINKIKDWIIIIYKVKEIRYIQDKHIVKFNKFYHHKMFKIKCQFIIQAKNKQIIITTIKIIIYY